LEFNEDLLIGEKGYGKCCQNSEYKRQYCKAANSRDEKQEI